MSAFLAAQADTLYPGAFAVVMATGIVSNALFAQHNRQISGILFVINAIAYAALLLATLARAVRMPRALLADLANPRLVFAFFTTVAASDVLGVGFLLRGSLGGAVALWLLACALWLILIYLSFAVLTFFNRAHSANIVDGAWLLAIVATQSLVVLGALITPSFDTLAVLISLATHMLWGIGLALYAVFITLFAYRVFFFAIEPDDLSPALWVVMGAAAITTNAGCVLALSPDSLPILSAIRPLVEATTLIVWAWATWWIPLLVMLGIWKHGVRAVPLRYTPALWSLVFPLGMYALASYRLSRLAGVAVFETIASVMVWIALAAWLATAAGLAVAVWRGYRGSLRLA